MKRFLLFLLVFLMLTACSVPHTDPTETPTLEPTPTETPTPAPTPTIPPSAAFVNGLFIAIADVDCKAAQLRDAYQQLGEEVPNEDALREEALEELINETLFLSAAQMRGLAPSAEELDARTQALCDRMGSCDNLHSWMEQNHYTGDSFRRALEREIAASNMRGPIFESLKQAEQLHVYRIWSDTRSGLTEAKNRLDMGISFIEIARSFDPVTGGDMSWFPRGVMFSQEVEDIIFGLGTGQYTDIIEADGVYNIFFVADKQTGREMDTQVAQLAQRKALADWLKEQRQQAQIEIF